MRIIIKATNIKLTEELRSFIEEKIGELEKFLEDILPVEVFVEIGKPSRHHRKGDVFYAECQISLPGKGVRSEAERENLQLAIVEIKDELQRLLKEYKARKTKKDIKFSKGARFYCQGRIREEGM